MHLVETIRVAFEELAALAGQVRGNFRRCRGTVTGRAGCSIPEGQLPKRDDYQVLEYLNCILAGHCRS